MNGNGINAVRRLHDVENLPAQQVDITRSLDELRQQLHALARAVEQGMQQQQGASFNPQKARAALVEQLSAIQAERKQLQEAAELWRKQIEPLRKEADELEQASNSWSGLGKSGAARLQELLKKLEPMDRKVAQYEAQIEHCNDEESNILDEMAHLDSTLRTSRTSRSNYNTGNGNGSR